MDNNERTSLARLIFALRGIGLVLGRPNGVLFATTTVVVILVSAFLGVQLQDWRWLAVAGALLWGAEGISMAVAEGSLRAQAAAAGVVMVCFLVALFVTAITLKPYADIYFAGLRGPIQI